MSGSFHVVSIVCAVCIAGFGTGCSTVSAKVAFEQRGDVSRCGSWNRLSTTPSSVDAAHADAAAIDARLARLIAQGLEGRGFERRRDADCYLAYHFLAKRSAVVVSEPMAPYLLSSLDSSPSYMIEGNRTGTRNVEDFQLVILIADGDGRTLWRASLNQRVENGGDLPLAAAVATLMEGLEPAAPAQTVAEN